MNHQAFAAARLSEIDSGEMNGRQFRQPFGVVSSFAGPDSGAKNCPTFREAGSRCAGVHNIAKD